MRTPPVVTGSPGFATPSEQPPAPSVIPHPVEPAGQPSGGWGSADLGPSASQSQSNVSELSEDVGEVSSKRLSVSPQLPDVARMSTFGVDLFGGSSSLNQPAADIPAIGEESSEKTPVAGLGSNREAAPSPASEGVKPSGEFGTGVKPGAPDTLRRPSLPGQWVTETPSVHIEPSEDEGPSSFKVDAAEVSPISDNATLSSQGAPERQDRTMLAHADPRMLPPLRTPSPHEPRTVGSPVSEQPSAQSEKQLSPEKPTIDITPTEPLQPKKPERSPSDYEPQPLTRPPTFSTVNSSPVKESDVLSDEIMRTLTPAANADENRASLSPGGPADVRASSYTLSDYDSYWAATGDDGEKSPVGVQPPVPTIPEDVAGEKSPTVASPPTQPLHVMSPVSSPPVTSPVDSAGGSSHLRRRFSWEQEELSAGNKQPAPVTSPAPASVTSPVIASPTVASPTSPGSDFSQDGRTKTFSSILQVSETGSVSHQVSNASTHKSSNEPASIPAPPSPISTTDAVHPGPAVPSFSEPKDRAASVKEDAALGLEPVSATPSVAISADNNQSAMAFKDIMQLGSVAGRIAKFKETQAIFASQDLGLNNWITMMKTDWPEHAQTNGSFSGSAVSPKPNTAAAPPQSTAEKPYYQQYLNANTSGSNPARSRLAALPAQAQAAGSAFGHSSGQIGHKGKEFMQSAGKMGKGLFSKGRSKLKGTGDKVFH